jgi:hypothetical protein
MVGMDATRFKSISTEKLDPTMRQLGEEEVDLLEAAEGLLGVHHGCHTQLALGSQRRLVQSLDACKTRDRRCELG